MTDLGVGGADHLDPLVLGLGLQQGAADGVLHGGLYLLRGPGPTVLDVQVLGGQLHVVLLLRGGKQVRGGRAGGTKVSKKGRGQK